MISRMHYILVRDYEENGPKNFPFCHSNANLH